MYSVDVIGEDGERDYGVYVGPFDSWEDAEAWMAKQAVHSRSDVGFGMPFGVDVIRPEDYRPGIHQELRDAFYAEMMA